MGTNYYATYTSTSFLGEKEEALHIGKDSKGFAFGLHVIPEMGLNSLEDWQEKILRHPAITIKDGYGDTISYEELLKIITQRDFGNVSEGRDGWSVLKSGEKFLRHTITDENCIGHGPGSWDYIPGEFC